MGFHSGAMLILISFLKNQVKKIINLESVIFENLGNTLLITGSLKNVRVESRKWGLWDSGREGGTIISFIENKKKYIYW